MRAEADPLAHYVVTRVPGRHRRPTGLPSPVVDLREPTMPGNGEQREPTIGEQLGLGVRWQPSPASFDWTKLPRVGAEPLHLLRLHTLGGVTGVVFDDAAMRKLIRQGQEQLTGLVLPADEGR